MKEFFEQMIGNKFDNYHRDNQERAPKLDAADREGDAGRRPVDARCFNDVRTSDRGASVGAVQGEFHCTGAVIGQNLRISDAVAFEKAGVFDGEKGAAAVRRA